MTCEQFVSKGLEMGWVNPNLENFGELFAPQKEQYEAGEEKHDQCKSEYNAALCDNFNCEGAEE